MEEYTVVVKDWTQNSTHRVKQLATSQQEANQIVMAWLKEAIGGDLELK